MLDEAPTKHKDICAYISKLASVFTEANDDNDTSRPFNERLDYSPGSITALDEMIEEIWDGDGPSENARNSTSLVFGSYVAEVLQRTISGKWKKADDGGFKFRPIGCDYSFQPWNWMMKKLVNDDSIAPKFLKAIELTPETAFLTESRCALLKALSSDSDN